MKKPLIIFAITLVWSLVVMSSEAKAQTCINNCIYGNATITINYAANRVEGFSYAQADYTAGLNYDPYIQGSIYRTDFPETDLDFKFSRGSSSSVAAVINLLTTNFVAGKTYCNYTNFFAVRRSTNYADYIGYFQDCKTIALPPTPTPTPTPPPPTPTPTPIPTPTPNVKVTEVGFTGDRPIRQYEVANNPYIEDPSADGTVAAWKSTNNPNYPTAYKKGTSPTLFAKISITPTLTTNVSAQIKILRGNNVVLTPRNITLTGSEIRESGISIPFTNLEAAEASEYVRKREYEFKWQISFDNGSHWTEIGKSKHNIHWLFADPPDEASFRPFVNGKDGTTYQGLFDKALDWSTGKIDKETDIKKVIQKINGKIEDQVIYAPNLSSYGNNPLEILDGQNGGKAVCADNALILRGLLRSIGFFDSKIEFFWGGDPETGKRNYYCPSGGCMTPSPSPSPANPVGDRLTMQTKRDQLGGPTSSEFVGRNPQFAYHAVVKYDSVLFDPSYGIIQGPNQTGLLTAVVPTKKGGGRCVHGAQATALLVSSEESFGNSNPAVNNDTGKTCDPIPNFLIAGADSYRFDGLGGADTAIVDGSTGEWIFRNEFGETTSLLSLGFNPTQGDALAPADYDGDGMTDPAVWYADGHLYYRMSSNYYKTNPTIWLTKGSGDKGVPGDYDGDGFSDLASWRPSDGTWSIRRSSDEVVVQVQWGLGSLGDVPVPGDYDNDGKTDIAVWRASTGVWWILRSSDGGVQTVNWGVSGDIPVQGDYDGDGTTDYAVVRPSTGVWYFLESENGYQSRTYQGPIFGATDLPVPADYNSDSQIDVAIWFRSSGMWHIVDSQTGDVRQEYFGQSSDSPAISASATR